jgi:hypothetical protein
MHPAPDRSADLEALEHWSTTEPDFDHPIPLWDSSRLDLDYAVSAMLARDSRATG